MTIDLLIEGFPAGKGAVRNGYRRNPSLPRPLQPVSVGFVGDDDGTFTGSISLTTLTVTSVPAGNISLGQFITGTGVNQGLKVRPPA